MGKYTKVLEGVPKLPRERSEYQLKIDEAKVELNEKKTSEIAQVYVNRRREMDALEEKEKALNIKIEAAEQLLLDRFDAEDIQSIKLDDGAMVSGQVEPYPGTTDKEAFRLWCIEQHLEKSMHLHPSTLTSLVKERLLSGDFVQCDGCKGEGTIDLGRPLEEGETNTCGACGGSGQLVAPGIRVFMKNKLLLTGRNKK